MLDIDPETQRHRNRGFDPPVRTHSTISCLGVRELDPGLLAIPRVADTTLPKRLVLDALSAGLGKIVNHLDEARYCVVRHPIATELDEFLRSEFLSRFDDHRDLHLIFTEFRGHRVSADSSTEGC